MKQTAVEWLVAEEDKLFTSYQKGFMNTARYILLKHRLSEQAKQMEKEQIIDAKDCWFEDERDGEQYYNETFGNQITDDTTSPNTKNK